MGIDPYDMESEIPPHVGADAHIGPLKYCEFASDLHKTGQFRRADRVVRPYGVKWKIKTDSPENRHKTGVFLRVDVGIDPYGAKQKIVAFCEVFCRGGRPCPPSKSGVFLRVDVGIDPYGAKSNPYTKIIFPHC